MEDIWNYITEWWGVLIGFFAAAAAWVATKFEWWKTQNKFIRVAVLVGVFFAFAFTLSILQALLG